MVPADSGGNGVAPGGGQAGWDGHVGEVEAAVAGGSIADGAVAGGAGSVGAAVGTAGCGTAGAVGCWTDGAAPSTRAAVGTTGAEARPSS
jgi:hypothetical protein